MEFNRVPILTNEGKRAVVIYAVAMVIPITAIFIYRHNEQTCVVTACKKSKCYQVNMSGSVEIEKLQQEIEPKYKPTEIVCK